MARINEADAQGVGHPAQITEHDSALASDAWTTLTRPLERVLGKRSANALAKLGLETVEDLVLHIPFRLAHRGELLPIEAVREGEAVTVVARVMNTNLRPMNNRRGFILTVTISDGVHDLSLTFFAKSSRPLKFHEMKLEPGTVATFSGTISSYRGALQLAHPEYELLEDEADVDAEEIARPVPIYHAAAKVPSWQIQKAIDTVLPSLTGRDFPDVLPEDYRIEHGLPHKFEAIRSLHKPHDRDEWARAIDLLKHEEAFVLQALLAQRAADARVTPAPSCPPKLSGIAAAFDERLPFELSAGQAAVGEEISAELTKTEPMRRLLQGDVGSGKTIVALRAMLQAVDSGHQAVLIAPTEVLAHQHLVTVESMLGDLAHAGTLTAHEHATRVQLLTGSMSAKDKRQALANIASGVAGIVIGTHALLQEGVQIPFLGLVVVDEQHRFGVDQRDKLAGGAHLLVMTATPIPRTIAMTLFGDLDVSTLNELPKGRKEISTTIVPAANDAWMARVWQRAREEIEAGGRVYVVCPRISADDGGEEAPNAPDASASATDTQSANDGQLDLGDLPGEPIQPKRPLASVEEIYERLSKLPTLNGIGIGFVHGQLSAQEKEDAMRAFASGEVPLLISTTVIEVGVDVPEATLMVIMDADRFGLSQLHQLRGRIGRGSKPGMCLAVSNALPGTLAAERLDAFASTTNGFILAERDVEFRSEGDVLGSVQSGRRSSLKYIKVTKDGDIIASTREAARALLDTDPTLDNHPHLSRAIKIANVESTQYLEKG